MTVYQVMAYNRYSDSWIPWSEPYEFRALAELMGIEIEAMFHIKTRVELIKKHQGEKCSK